MYGKSEDVCVIIIQSKIVKPRTTPWPTDSAGLNNNAPLALSTQIKANMLTVGHRRSDRTVKNFLVVVNVHIL
jgi:hypothetical protein